MNLFSIHTDNSKVACSIEVLEDIQQSPSLHHFSSHHLGGSEIIAGTTMGELNELTIVS